MIELDTAADLTLATYDSIVYDGELVSVSGAALRRVSESRAAFLRHLDTGVICYGVTTGLGAQSGLDLTAEQMCELPRHTLLGRASATGPALPHGVGRGALLAKLVQFLDGRSAVSADLCDVLADRLNRGIDPVVPGQGHGAAGEIIGLSHVCQTLIGVGRVFTADGTAISAAGWHDQQGIEPYDPQPKEGLSLISGTGLGPAFAWHLTRRVDRLLNQSTLVAAASIEALAAPLEPYSSHAASLSPDPVVAEVSATLRGHVAGSAITRHDRQAPVSYRVTPQVHAAALGAADQLRGASLAELRANGDNPAFFTDPESPTFGTLIHAGNFHGALLVARVEALTTALVHVGILAEKRLYRLLDDRASGLTRQLSHRPGLDAGLITVHKSALDLSTSLRLLGVPVSVTAPDSSFGQEDLQTMVVPALRRLADAIELVAALSAHELTVAGVAIDQRGERPGDDIAELHRRLRLTVAPADGDRPPGPDLDVVIDWLRIGD
ncbi:MAG: aromatic amino acid lyase [Ilumatobacteraceae bacterium]